MLPRLAHPCQFHHKASTATRNINNLILLQPQPQPRRNSLSTQATRAHQRRTAKMADYSKEKVPDLKKLLQERGLVISGNKADLIARLQEDDSKKAGGGAGISTFPHTSSSCSLPPHLQSSSSFHGDCLLTSYAPQQQQAKMKSTGTKTTRPPPNPQQRPSQQAVKAPCQTPPRSRTKSSTPSPLQPAT